MSPHHSHETTYFLRVGIQQCHLSKCSLQFGAQKYNCPAWFILWSPKCIFQVVPAFSNPEVKLHNVLVYIWNPQNLIHNMISDHSGIPKCNLTMRALYIAAQQCNVVWCFHFVLIPEMQFPFWFVWLDLSVRRLLIRWINNLRTFRSPNLEITLCGKQVVEGHLWPPKYKKHIVRLYFCNENEQAK